MKKQPLKIGLALGGGGARGYAHLGAIKCFEEYGIKFDYISGTSAGSLVAALYSEGYNYEELLNIAKKINLRDIKKNFIFFMPDSTDGIQKIIKDNCTAQNVEDLKVPTSIIAVDMISGQEIDITSGNLAKAVAGSCCVPSVFSPVVFENYHLCDGGLSNTIPSDICKKHGMDVVIGVDVNPTRGQGTDSLKLLDILSASLRIMMKSNAIKGELYSDVLIAPNLKKFSSTNNEGWQEMIEIGYNTAKQKMPEILALIRPEKVKLMDKIKSIFKKHNKNKQIEKFEENHNSQGH